VPQLQDFVKLDGCTKVGGITERGSHAMGQPGASSNARIWAGAGAVIRNVAVTTREFGCDSYKIP
jgi:hypothetical protein